MAQNREDSIYSFTGICRTRQRLGAAPPSRSCEIDQRFSRRLQRDEQNAGCSQAHYAGCNEGGQITAHVLTHDARTGDGNRCALRVALADLMAWLDAPKIPSMVIGGVAASVSGRPRLTQDVDQPD